MLAFTFYTFYFLFQCAWWCVTAVFCCLFASAYTIISAAYMCGASFVSCVLETTKTILISFYWTVKFVTITLIRCVQVVFIIVVVIARCLIFICIPRVIWGFLCLLKWTCEAVLRLVYWSCTVTCVIISIACFTFSAVVRGLCCAAVVTLTGVCGLVSGAALLLSGLLCDAVGGVLGTLTGLLDRTCGCLSSLAAPEEPALEEPPALLGRLSLIGPLPRARRSRSACPPPPPPVIPPLVPHSSLSTAIGSPGAQGGPAVHCAAAPRGSRSLTDVLEQTARQAVCRRRVEPSFQETESCHSEPCAAPAPEKTGGPQPVVRHVHIRPVPRPSRGRRKLRRTRAACDWQCAHDCGMDCC